MLIEIRCDKFISYGDIRPSVYFHPGLNTVLGSETGSNSIGKSTFLMIIDFVFGGEDYILKSTDVQNQVGAHVVKYAFKFNNVIYYFSRETINHTIVCQCNDNYNPIKDMKIDEYRKLLFDLYNIDLPSISFRDIVGRYFRIYGRENLDEKKPLHNVKKEPDKAAIIALMKLFNVFAPVGAFEKAVTLSKNEKNTYKKAQDFNFLPKIGVQKYRQNEKRLIELEEELTRLQEISGDIIMGLNSEQAQIVADLRQSLTNTKRQKSRLMSQLRSIENDIEFNAPRLESNFEDLLHFFPKSDLKKFNDIEQFHRQLVTVLITEFEETKSHLSSLISIANNEIGTIEEQIIASGLTPKVSRSLLEDYSFKKSEIRNLSKEIETYDTMKDLRETAKVMEDRLNSLLDEQLGFLQGRINAKMDKINDFVYRVEKLPPVLTIKNPKNYTFLTPNDTGTGTSYKGLAVFDLMVMQTTPLPALIHDSVILKQIGDDPLEKILELYNETSKQVFIALDKKSSYSKKSQEILQKTKILDLTENGNELFGRSWNTK